MTFSVLRFRCHRASRTRPLVRKTDFPAVAIKKVGKGEPQAGWGPGRLGSQTEGIVEGELLCLPWDSSRVSNDCPKLEQMFKSSKGACSKPETVAENTPCPAR